jgi:hypothetical protein
MAVATLFLRDRVQNAIISDSRIFRDTYHRLRRFDFLFSLPEWSNIAGFEKKAEGRGVIRGDYCTGCTNSR